MIEDHDYRIVSVQIDTYRYKDNSLKNTTRLKRADSKEVQHKVEDNTIIRNLKEFLSHHGTKRDLTKYLAETLLAHSLKKPVEEIPCKFRYGHKRKLPSSRHFM